ncbi:MAG: hypothetical protein QM692_04595 [Thermomicrobiales bacterium]
MEHTQLEHLLRAVAASPSRRAALRLVGASLLGAGLAGAPAALDAKKKKPKKVTICHQGQTLKVSKKASKQHLQHGDTPGPCPTSSPPPGVNGCPAGQKPCDGACIPADQCCDNADCDIFRQTCNATGQCVCPAALPEVCGGACLAPCTPFQTRTPSCSCCLRNGEPSTRASDCCSLQYNASSGCLARQPGEACTFDAQCSRENCVYGSCSSCSHDGDICKYSQSTCGAGGCCLKAVDGTTRCGSRISSIECGQCSDDAACDQGQGLGYFCARSTGTGCSCATGETFCARPR